MGTRSETVQFVYEVVGDKETAAQVVALLKLADAGQLVDESISALATTFKEFATAANLADTAIAQKAGLTELSASTDAAIAKLAELQAGFTATDIAAGNTSAEYKRAEAAVASLTVELNAQQVAFAKTEGALQKAGVDTANLASESVRLRAAAAQTAAELGAVGVAARESAAGFAEIAEKSTVLSRVKDTVIELVKVIGGLFALEKVKELLQGIFEEGDKAEKFGLQFSNAFGGAEKGAEALARVREIAERVPLALDDITQAALRAKKEGLDPFSGTLEALININAKYGGSVDNLNTLIDLFGKVTNKGQVDLRTLTALQQQGIPATQLLGDAMGKTTDEITALAKAGKLGGDAVKTLLQAFNESSQGEAAAQLETLTGQTVQLHNAWQEFLELIANSGAYQFVVGQLRNINAAFKEGLADGSLAKTAQAISDAITGTGRALAAMTRFVIDNATAIGVAVKGYVLFRATLLALDLAAAAEKMLGLAAATKAAGTAAEAAAEAGGFGKLVTAIGKIPKAVQIAVTVAAVDFALTQVEELGKALGDLVANQIELQRTEEDTANIREKNAARAQIVFDKLKGFIDVQIADTDTLANKTKAQTDAYIEQLENAARALTALRIIQQSQGDTAGVEETTKKLQAIGIAAEAAKQHIKDLGDGLKTLGGAVTEAVDRFDKLRTAGVASADAIAGAFKDIDVTTPTGFAATLEIIRQIAARGTEAGQAVQSELVAALEKLNQTDLSEFQAKVFEALKGAKGAADDLKLALGAALSASLLQLGASAEQAGVQVTESGEKMIAAFQNVASNALSSANQIQLAFALALKGADTSGAVQQLEGQLTELFNTGQIGADQFAASMQAAGRRTAELQIAAIQASASLDGVGKEGQTAGDRISGALQDARDQLITLENSLTTDLNAALAAGNDALAAQIRAKIAEVSTEVDTFNQKIQQIANTKVSPPDLGGTHDGFQQVNQDVEQYQSGVEGITFANKEAADAFEELGGSAGSTGNLLGALQNDYSRFSAVSSAAVKKFSDTMKELFTGTGNFSVQAITDSTNIIKAGEAAAQASQIVQAQIDEQRQGVAALAAQYQDFGATATLATLGTSRNLDAIKASLEGDAAAARAGQSAFTLLGQADLSPLAAALDAAAQKVEQLKQQAEQAKAQLEDLASSIQDQIDELTGNQEDEENRRFERQLEQIKEQAKLAGDLNSAETQKLIRDAERLHELKLKQIREQQAAQQQANQADGGAGGGTGSGGPGGGQGGGAGDGVGGGGTGTQPNGPTVPQAPVFNFTVHGSVIGGTPDQIADQLAKLIKPKLDQIARRSA